MSSPHDRSHSDRTLIRDSLRVLLRRYKDGSLPEANLIGGLLEVMGALNVGNTAEAVAWFENDGAFFMTHPAGSNHATDPEPRIESSSHDVSMERIAKLLP